jgi:hypothetical protein
VDPVQAALGPLRAEVLVPKRPALASLCDKLVIIDRPAMEGVLLDGGIGAIDGPPITPIGPRFPTEDLIPFNIVMEAYSA